MHSKFEHVCYDKRMCKTVSFRESEQHCKNIIRSSAPNLP